MKKTQMVKLDLTEIELNQVIVALIGYKEFFEGRKMPLVESILQRLTAQANPTNEEAE